MHVGIDLGTTNSLIAYWDGESACLIPNALGDFITPSAVSIDATGNIFVGKIALERRISHPDCSISGFKRKMGTNHRFNLNGKKFSAEELSSLVLKQLKEDAETFLKQPIENAVISVPAYFSDSQRRATKVAAELAGLKVERLINEPTAAAVAYGVQDRNQENQFLVLDLGGGTFDVSILEIFDGVLEVHASAGDNFLGGDDFTAEISKWVLHKSGLETNKLNDSELKKLDKNVQKIKHQLTENEEAKLTTRIGNRSIELEIDRSVLNQILSPMLERLSAPIERAIRDSSISARDLDDILLVGGATRMPVVRALVSRKFKRLPSCNIDPDQVVAKGAAIQAALKARDKALEDIVMTDVCPYTLGVEIAQELGNNQYRSGYFLPIIERNTTIPVSRVDTLNTIVDNQKIVTCEIFQGESRLVKNNINLGTVEVEVPKAKAGEESIDVRFTYDINGILEVHVTVNSTGKTKKTIIKSSQCNLSEEEIEKSIRKLDKLKIHPREQAENRYLLARAERLYEESLSDKRQYVAELVKNFELILESQDLRKIEVSKKEFESLLIQIEEDALV